VNVIRVREKEYVAEIEFWANEVFKARICCRELFKRLQCNMLQNIDSSELQEDELITSQTQFSVSLKSVKTTSSPINDKIKVTENEYKPP